MHVAKITAVDQVAAMLDSKVAASVVAVAAAIAGMLLSRGKMR